MKQLRGVIVVTLVALVVVALLGSQSGGSRARFPSSYAPEPEGSKAFRMWLEQQEIPHEVWKRPWQQLEEPPGVVLLTTPFRRGIDSEEMEAMRRYLEQGGSLLVFDDASIVEGSSKLNDLFQEVGLPALSPATDLDFRTFMPARPDTQPARGTAAYPAGEDLETLILNKDAYFESGIRGIPLAVGLDDKIVAAEASLGEGRVVRVMGPLIANDRISRGDNLRFAFRLIEDLRGAGPVLFDEFHHGYGGMAARIGELQRSALVWAFIQGALAILLYGIARGVRFGPPWPAPATLRRSSLEYVHSMASLYRRARFSGPMIGAIAARLRRTFQDRLHIEGGLNDRQLAERAAQRLDKPTGEIERLLSVGDALSRSKIRERDMLERARAAERLEQEVLRGDGSAS